jgi:hypothetical protein
MKINKQAQTDPDLDELVASGDALSYEYCDVDVTGDDRIKPYQSAVITLPSGNKLCIYSSSPESSYLSFEVYKPKE